MRWPMLMQLAERLRVARPRSSLSLLPGWRTRSLSWGALRLRPAPRLPHGAHVSFVRRRARSLTPREALSPRLHRHSERPWVRSHRVVPRRDPELCRRGRKGESDAAGPSAAAAAKPPSPSASATATAATATTPPPAAIASVRERGVVAGRHRTRLLVGADQRAYRPAVSPPRPPCFDRDRPPHDILIAWQAREAWCRCASPIGRNPHTRHAHRSLAHVCRLRLHHRVQHRDAPDRRSLHRRVLGAPFHTDVQATRRDRRHAGRAAPEGVKPGSTVLSLGIPPTRGHAAVWPALQVSARLPSSESRVRWAGWRTLARSPTAARFRHLSWRIRIL